MLHFRRRAQPFSSIITIYSTPTPITTFQLRVAGNPPAAAAALFTLKETSASSKNNAASCWSWAVSNSTCFCHHNQQAVRERQQPHYKIVRIPHDSKYFEPVAGCGLPIKSIHYLRSFDLIGNNDRWLLRVLRVRCCCRAEAVCTNCGVFCKTGDA